MKRAYVLLIGLSMLLISLIVTFPLALSFVILAGFFIAHFSKMEEKEVNMIITAIISLFIGLLGGLLRSMIHHNISSTWTLLSAHGGLFFIALIGYLFMVLILMTLGSMIDNVISKARSKSL
ncbi:hypothetical protein [Methanothermobacter sp.]|uniref:hypothetical protein n=1 Tax=Methanothermobacter sp. TaxID=1884223 RepID=UPI003C75A852